MRSVSGCFGGLEERDDWIIHHLSLKKQKTNKTQPLLVLSKKNKNEEITFPPGLSNHDRAVVHAECRKYGLRSKSHGKGESRTVTIYKPKEKSRAAGVFDLPFSAASAAALRAHFEQHPPTPEEVARAESEAAGVFAGDDDVDDEVKKSLSMEDENGTRSNEVSNNTSNKNRNGSAASMSPEQVAAARAAHAAAVKAAGPQLAHARANLPIAAFREEIVRAVREHRVVLVAGETGCGKTTQVRERPFLLSFFSRLSSLFFFFPAFSSSFFRNFFFFFFFSRYPT